MCSATSNSDCAGTGSGHCGSTLGGSTDPGVCGGAGASCYSDKECATGACRGYQCIPWQSTLTLPIDAKCDYSVQCNGDTICVDDGTGVSRCRAATSLRARLCDYANSRDCQQDPTYSQCGSARPGSTEPGVCGGQGAFCFGESCLSIVAMRLIQFRRYLVFRGYLLQQPVHLFQRRASGYHQDQQATSDRVPLSHGFDHVSYRSERQDCQWLRGESQV